LYRISGIVKIHDLSVILFLVFIRILSDFWNFIFLWAFTKKPVFVEIHFPKLFRDLPLDFMVHLILNQTICRRSSA
jgi:hypothetical protein